MWRASWHGIRAYAVVSGVVAVVWLRCQVESCSITIVQLLLFLCNLEAGRRRGRVAEHECLQVNFFFYSEGSHVGDVGEGSHVGEWLNMVAKEVTLESRVVLGNAQGQGGRKGKKE